jgi:hypothetical protein
MNTEETMETIGDQIVKVLIRSRRPCDPAQMFDALGRKGIGRPAFKQALWRLIDSNKVDFNKDWKVQLLPHVVSGRAKTGR